MRVSLKCRRVSIPKILGKNQYTLRLSASMSDTGMLLPAKSRCYRVCVCFEVSPNVLRPLKMCVCVCLCVCVLKYPPTCCVPHFLKIRIDVVSVSMPHSRISTDSRLSTYRQNSLLLICEIGPFPFIVLAGQGQHLARPPFLPLSANQWITKLLTNLSSILQITSKTKGN